MRKANKLTLTTSVALLSTAVISTSAFSASFDFRHEYRQSSEQHASRIKINESIDNLYFSGEMKFKGNEGDFLSGLQNNGWEFDWGYKHQLNNNWTLIPGMPIEARSAGMTYKPQLRLTYAFDEIEGLSISGRYRYDMYQNSTESNKRRHRLTGNLYYSVDDWSFGLEANHYQADGYNIFDDKETDYEFNSSIRKKIGSWSPYAELGYLGYKKDGGNTAYDTNNDHELRTRVGVSYSF